MNRAKIKGVIVIEGHIQGLSNTQSLGVNSIPVWVIDTKSCMAKYSKYCNNFILCPDFNSDGFAHFLVKLAQENEVKDWLLMPSNDHAVSTISKHRAVLLKYYKVLTPDFAVIENIYDKLKLIELAKGINIPTPETYHLNTINSDALKSIKYPVITKGRNGLTFYKKTKKKALIAEDKDSLMNQLHSLEQLMPIDMAFTQGIIQSNGNNKTISFTSFCVDGQIKTFWMGVKLREHPVKFGTATFVKSTYVHEIREHSIKLIQELNYTGICEIEYLLDPADNQYKLIEVNPRTWLWVGLARSCGINYAKIAYDFVNDIPITYPQEYSTEKYWYNPITDYVYGLKSIMQTEITFRSFLHSLIKKKQSALFFKLDFKPGVFYILNIFKFYRNR